MTYPPEYHKACAALINLDDEARIRPFVARAIRALRRQGRTRDQIKAEIRHFVFVNPRFLDR